jgi:hypothetical protein
MPDLPITYRVVVYPWQCDHKGHMNVMWYVGKFDEEGGIFLLIIKYLEGIPSHAKLRKLNFPDIHADKLSGDR